MSTAQNDNVIPYLLLAAVVGSIAGFLGSIFHWVVDYVMVWPQYFIDQNQGVFAYIIPITIVSAATILVVYMVRKYAPEAAGSGIQEIEGAMNGRRQLKWRSVLPVKFSMGIVALGSCLSLGREGPTIHIGAAVGSGLSEVLGRSEADRRGLLSAGGAAGLACAFNAPLAAIIFIMEETREEFPYTFKNYMAVIVAVIGATIVTQLFLGNAAMLSVDVTAVDASLFPFFVVFGGLLGALGVCLNYLILRALDLASRDFIYKSYLFPALVGAFIGFLTIYLPYATTGGEAIILKLFSENHSFQFLIALAFLRFAGLVLCYATGVPGGVFAPMLTLAVCVGLGFGVLIEMSALIDVSISHALAVAAMAGLFTATIRSPMVGTVLTVELTGTYDLILPIIITCACANYIANLLGGRPLYEQLLERTLSVNAH